MPTAKQLADIGYKTFSTSMMLLTVYGGYLCSVRAYHYFQRRSSRRQAAEEQKTSGALLNGQAFFLEQRGPRPAVERLHLQSFLSPADQGLNSFRSLLGKSAHVFSDTSTLERLSNQNRNGRVRHTY